MDERVARRRQEFHRRGGRGRAIALATCLPIIGGYPGRGNRRWEGGSSPPLARIGLRSVRQDLAGLLGTPGLTIQPAPILRSVEIDAIRAGAQARRDRPTSRARLVGCRPGVPPSVLEGRCDQRPPFRGEPIRGRSPDTHTRSRVSPGPGGTGREMNRDAPRVPPGKHGRERFESACREERPKPRRPRGGPRTRPYRPNRSI